MSRFFETLEKVRQKPVSSRRRVALGLSLSFTLLMGIVWLAFTDFNLSGSVEAVASESDITIKGPIESIKDDFKDLMGLVENLKNIDTE